MPLEKSHPPSGHDVGKAKSKRLRLYSGDAIVLMTCVVSVVDGIILPSSSRIGGLSWLEYVLLAAVNGCFAIYVFTLVLYLLAKIASG